ncbi:MAG: PmoA family protein [Candidatus Omnitrophica bacterium]|nr:PmoA family protein [Candidatus Omnitrophota bacterium]
MKRYNLYPIFILSILFLSNCASLEQTPIQTANLPSIQTPVAFEIPSPGQYILRSPIDNSLFPVQTSADGQTGSALIPASEASLPEFSLQKVKRLTLLADSFRWDDDGKTTLSLYEGDRLVLQYHYGVIQPPEGVPADRARSSYIHPLKGLDGETLTEDFPKDHYHHRGLYFAWPGVFIDGKQHDMWHIQDIWNRCEKILDKQAGPVYASLTIQNGWCTTDRKVMTELMELKVWHSGEIGQTIDLKFTWTPLEPIQIGPKDYKGYGGLNFRFPAQNRTNTVVANRDGIQPTSDLIRSPWTDFSAQFDNREAASGVTFINHPQNIDPNPGWTIRSSDSYGYIGISWPGKDTFDFAPNNTYTNQYRLWIHRGDRKEGQAEEAVKAYFQTDPFEIR